MQYFINAQTAHRAHTIAYVCTAHLPQNDICILRKRNMHTPTNASTVNVTLSHNPNCKYTLTCTNTHSIAILLRTKKRLHGNSYFRFPSRSHTVIIVMMMMTMMTQTTQTLYNNWANTPRCQRLIYSVIHDCAIGFEFAKKADEANPFDSQRRCEIKSNRNPCNSISITLSYFFSHPLPLSLAPLLWTAAIQFQFDFVAFFGFAKICVWHILMKEIAWWSFRGFTGSRQQNHVVKTCDVIKYVCTIKAFVCVSMVIRSLARSLSYLFICALSVCVCVLWLWRWHVTQTINSIDVIHFFLSFSSPICEVCVCFANVITRNPQQHYINFKISILTGER